MAHATLFYHLNASLSQESHLNKGKGQVITLLTLEQVHRNVSVLMVVMSKKTDCFQWEMWDEFTCNGYLAIDFSEMSLLTQIICG